MIDHVCVSVRDPQRSRAFYERALAPLGYRVLHEFESGAVVGFGEGGKADFWIGPGAPPDPDEVHVAFRARDVAQVQAFHMAGLAAGGRDNGAPGPRPEYHAGYYGAFLLDPDGYNVEAAHHGIPAP